LSLDLDGGPKPAPKAKPGLGVKRPSPFATKRPSLQRPGRGSARIPSVSKMETVTEGPDSTPTPDAIAAPDLGSLLDDDGGLGVGLALDVAAPVPKPKAPAQNANAAAQVNASLGIFDEGDDDDGGLDIGLDLGSVPPPGKLAPAHPPASSGGLGAAESPATDSVPMPKPSAPDVPAAPAPIPSSPLAGSPAPMRPPPVADPERVRALADYGPFPPNIAATPLYAINVIKRRLQLKTQHKQQVRLHDDTVRSLRDEIASEVTRMVEASSGGELDVVKRSLMEADSVVKERNQVMDSAASAFASRFKAVEDELSKQQAARKDTTKARDMAQIQVEDAQQQRARVDEERRRVETQLAVAHDAARDAADAGAQFAPPEHARQIGQLQKLSVAVAKQLAERDAKLGEARRHLRERQRGIKAVDEAIAGVHRQNASLEKEASQTHGAAIEALRQAQGYRLDSYEQALGQLEAQHGSLVDADLRGRIAAVRERIKEADVELESYRLAVDAYDQDGVKRGLAVLSLVVLIVLLVLGTFVRIAW
jgi:hypothetical protein